MAPNPDTGLLYCCGQLINESICCQYQPILGLNLNPVAYVGAANTKNISQ